mgnify:CR=1 FL=1
MRIVYIGTVDFSRRILQELVSMRCDVVGVCTAESSAVNSDHCDLSAVSREHGIPWIYVDDINDERTVIWIRDKRPDVIFCFGWSRLLGKPILDIAPLGVVGYHPSALPENRGRHPIIWALVLGLKETGSTFFFLDEGADSGDVLSQRSIQIDPDDDAADLYRKVTDAALEQVREFVPDLEGGRARAVSQDRRRGNAWRKRNRADGRIDWRMSAQSIRNLVRGLARPYVGAHFDVGGQEVRVWRAEVVSGIQRNIEPGKVVAHRGGAPIVKCGEDAVLLVETEPQFVPKKGVYL